MRIFKSTINDMVGSYKQKGIHLVLDVLVTDSGQIKLFHQPICRLNWHMSD